MRTPEKTVATITNDITTSTRVKPKCTSLGLDFWTMLGPIFISISASFEHLLCHVSVYTGPSRRGFWKVVEELKTVLESRKYFWPWACGYFQVMPSRAAERLKRRRNCIHSSHLQTFTLVAREPHHAQRPIFEPCARFG